MPRHRHRSIRIAHTVQLPGPHTNTTSSPQTSPLKHEAEQCGQKLTRHTAIATVLRKYGRTVQQVRYSLSCANKPGCWRWASRDRRRKSGGWMLPFPIRHRILPVHFLLQDDSFGVTNRESQQNSRPRHQPLSNAPITAPGFVQLSGSGNRDKRRAPSPVPSRQTTRPQPSPTVSLVPSRQRVGSCLCDGTHTRAKKGTVERQPAFRVGQARIGSKPHRSRIILCTTVRPTWRRTKPNPLTSTHLTTLRSK